MLSVPSNVTDPKAWYSKFEAELGPEDSVASYLAKKAGNGRFLRDLLGSLTDAEVAQLVFDLDFWARRQQIPPEGLWTCCLMLAGRGFGKTFAGSRWVNRKAANGKSLGVLVGPTAADYRDTMIRGPSGVLSLAPPWFQPVFEPSKRRVSWPNGVYATCFSADKPDRLRGPNAGWAWGDEPASWKHEMAALDQLPLVLRIGTAADPPQLLLTGTPKPLKKLQELIARPGTVLVRGSSLANRANLAPTALREMQAMMQTRWGRQEVLGELLMDVPGAIFGSAKWGRVENVDPLEYARTLERRVVAVDPAPSSDSGSDEWGIIGEGVKRVDGHKRVSILADASGRYSPREGATIAIKLYLALGADTLVVEVNSGGEMVETLISTVAAEMGVHVNVKAVRAKEHKSKRAEPVSALAETGRIEFVGKFPKLEKQLETFVGINGRRDDRADAMNWGVHEIAFGEEVLFI